MQLTKSVPVKCGAVPPELVGYCDLQSVPPTSLNPRPWVRAIDNLPVGLVVTIRVDPMVGHLEVILGYLLASISKRAGAKSPYLADDTFRPNLIVIGMDVKGLPSDTIPQPGLSIQRACAMLPIFHGRVLALNFGRGAGRGEYGSVVILLDLVNRWRDLQRCLVGTIIVPQRTNEADQGPKCLEYVIEKHLEGDILAKHEYMKKDGAPKLLRCKGGKGFHSIGTYLLQGSRPTLGTVGRQSHPRLSSSDPS